MKNELANYLNAETEKLKASQRRQNRLMPNGIPKWIRCYDLKSIQPVDNFTVCFTRKQGGGSYLGMNSQPFHPSYGVAQHGEGKNGRAIDTNKWGFAPMIGRKNHLGKRIAFSDLPPDCQKLVLSDYKAIWNLQ
jgi:hypothetical protein